MTTSRSKTYKVRIFFHETEGCTYDILDSVLPLFDAIGFDLIYTHLGTFMARGTDVNRKIPATEQISNETPLLQRDCAYIYCSMEDSTTVIGNKPLYRVLLIKEDNPSKKETFPLNLEFTREKDFNAFPLPVRKDIQFLDMTENTEVGWYNIRANILWVSDIVHREARAVPLLEHLLKTILYYRIHGKFKQESLILGGDPEFEVLDRDNQCIPARSLFAREKDAQIGCDGVDTTGELRPTPSRNPIGLIRNIKRLVRNMCRNPKLTASMRICAGGGVSVTTGGHIHFNLPDGKRTRTIIGHLHDLVGEYVLQFQRGNRSSNSSTCVKGGTDSIRSEKDLHGGTEWRSLPSWLSSEEAATTILVTVFCVTRALQNNQIRIGADLDLEKKKLILRRLPLYRQYSQYIEDFISLFYDQKAFPVEGIELRDKWGVPLLKREYDVVIVTDNPYTKEYFTPIVLGLSRPIKIHLQFTNPYKITGFGVPASTKFRIKEMTKKHFMPEPGFAGISEYKDSIVHGHGADTILLFPQVWLPTNIDMNNCLCREIKSIIKEIVVALNEGGDRQCAD